MNSLLFESRGAVRSLWRTPGFTIAAIATLALGITISSTVPSVALALLHAPSPFRGEAVAVVQLLRADGPERNEPVRAGLTAAQLLTLRERAKTLAAVGLYRPATPLVQTQGTTKRLTGVHVSPELFSHITAAPHLGRVLTPSDALSEVPGILLSHRAWVDHAAADPGVVGKTFLVDRVEHRVVGVMVDGFEFPQIAGGFRDARGRLVTTPEFWLPLPSREADSARSVWPAVAILRPGVDSEQARIEMLSLLPPLPIGEGAGLEVVELNDEIMRSVSGVIRALEIAAVMVLMIACINVTNLLLVRSARDYATINVRIALGATRRHLVRQHVLECLLIVSVAGLLSLLAVADLMLLVRLIAPATVPNVSHVRFGQMHAGLTVLVAVITAVAIILLTTTKNLGAITIRTTGRPRSWARPRALGRPSSVLVAFEIAAALVLVAVAGLFVHSYTVLANLDAGYITSEMLTFRTTMPTPDPGLGGEPPLGERLQNAIRQLPHVTAVAASGVPRIVGGIRLDGRALTSSVMSVRTVEPDFLRTIGSALTRGRWFVESDRRASAPVAIVNETFAAQNGDSGRGLVGGRLDFGTISVEIVGIVRDIRFGAPEVPVRPELYLPIDSDRLPPTVVWMMRTPVATDTASLALSEAVRELDPRIVLHEMGNVDTIRWDDLANRRLYTTIAATFAFASLVLTCVGVFCLLSDAVVVRLPDLATRLVLGASSGHVFWSVVRHGVAVAGCGVLLGSLGVAAVAPLMHGLLFGIRVFEPSTLLVIASLFAAATGSAGIWPARIALSLTPREALVLADHRMN